MKIQRPDVRKNSYVDMDTIDVSLVSGRRGGMGGYAILHSTPVAVSRLVCEEGISNLPVWVASQRSEKEPACGAGLPQ